MFCPICGKEIEDDKEQFCKYCKADLSEKLTSEESLKILCPNCKKEIDVGNEEVSFCKFCGSKLTEEGIDEQTTTITCPHCNKEIDIGRGDVKFCKHCGSNIYIYDEKRPMYCYNCGKKIDQTDSESMFCKYCGVSLSKVSTNFDSKKRPVGVSVIAWLIIVGVLIAFLSLLILGWRRMSIYTNPALALFDIIISVLLAIGLLKGKNWCRITYLIYYPIIEFISFIDIIVMRRDNNIVFDVFLAIVWYTIIVIVLTRPNASRFFKVS